MKTFIIIVMMFPLTMLAQRKASDNEMLLTAGFQFRPVLASKFLDAGEQITFDREFKTTIKPVLGYTFGMVVRRGFTRTISLEVGINYLRRNFEMTNEFDSLNLKDVSRFGMVGYEIPIQGLIYVRLGENFYMNNAFGMSINWFASDVSTRGNNNLILQYTALRRVPFNPALLANIGFEYRTEKAGFFYLGASLHRPFRSFATTWVNYDLGSKKYNNYLDLTGSFLTVDVRYFFHEHPIKKKVHKEKKKKTE